MTTTNLPITLFPSLIALFSRCGRRMEPASSQQRLNFKRLQGSLFLFQTVKDREQRIAVKQKVCLLLG